MLFIHKVRSNEKDILLSLLQESGLQAVEWEHYYPTFMLAELDDKVIGIGGIEIYGQYALLRNLYVKEAYRGQFLGDAIVRSLLNMADLCGVKQVYTVVEDKKLFDFFGRIGFVPTVYDTLQQKCGQSQWLATQKGDPLKIDLNTFFNTPCSGHK